MEQTASPSSGDAEKDATSQVAAKQAEHVPAPTVHQSTINQEISNDFQQAKTAIAADRQRLLTRIPVRLRVDTADSTGPLPAAPYVNARTDAVAADAVSATACEKLAADAAQTTLMVVAFQRWYREQRDANGNP